MAFLKVTLVGKLLPFLLFVFSNCHSGQNVAEVKRHVSELDSSYDYIIVGGGTSGMTVADRLSEDGKKTVLVIEYGHIDDGTDIIMPSPANNDRYLPRFYNYTTVPQAELLNQTTIAYAAAVVGGGSTVDHMMHDRGSADDYDNWEKLSNPGWGWKGLYPYFKKSVTFVPPTQQQQKDYGYTYDASAFGDGPILASYPPYQWPQQKIQWNSWLDLGIEANPEGAGGKALGLFWIPSSLNPKTMTRSYTRTGHYDPASKRKNFHLITGYKAREIVFTNRLQAKGIAVQARDSPDKKVTTIDAKVEVVLAAGTFGSPILLQRSGVGPQSLLMRAKIDVKLDLPGVGQNLQDHPASLLLYGYGANTVPNSATVATNATFAAEVQAQYSQNKTGPLTVGYGNSVVFLPLQTIDSNYSSLLTKLAAQDSASFLPSTYDKTLLAGYTAQKKLLQASYASNDSAILETFFNGDPSSLVVLQKPMSRGTVEINITDPVAADPLIDPRTFSNPIDIDIDVAMIKFARKWFQTPSHSTLAPFEILPGAAVTSDADIITSIRTYSTPSIGHASGTCAMMPLELGGVVGPDLLVHGIKGLSVVDASIFPLEPATHLDATVYAVAEKAADLIKARAK